MPGRSKQIRIVQFPGPPSRHKLRRGPIAAATRRKAMNEELTPRIYREYCWFALLLLVMTIGFVGRPPPGEPRARAGGGPPRRRHRRRPRRITRRDDLPPRLGLDRRRRRLRRPRR